MRQLIPVLGLVLASTGSALASSTVPSPVPEPGTLLLTATGVAGAIWLLRKAKKKG